MRSHKKLWMAGGVLLIAILLVTGSLIVAQRGKTPPSERAEATAAGLQITILSPYTGDAYPLNSVIPVDVRAEGNEFTILELWVDSDLIEARDVSNTSATRIQWHWTPAEQGLHTLLVRAHDAAGQVILSNAVQLNITEPVSPSVQIEAQAGDTAASIAARYHVDPADVHPAQKNENGDWSVHPPPPPAENPDAPLAPGQPVLVGMTLRFPPSQPKISRPKPAQGPVAGAKIVDAIELSENKALPLAPTLSGKISGCQVMLTFNDTAKTEEGFYVMRQAEGETVFHRIAILGKNDGAHPLSFVDPKPVVSAVYVVAAVNGVGQNPSNPWAAHIADAACFNQGDSTFGNHSDGVQIIGSKLIIPESADASYFYYSTDDGKNWQRAPEDDNQFVVPDENGAIALGQLLKPTGMDNGTLSIDAWSWKQRTLEHEGKANQALDKFPRLLICPGGCAGDVAGNWREFSLSMPWSENPWDIELEVKNWDKHATSFVWQISSTPFPPGPVLLKNTYTVETAPAAFTTLPLPESMRAGGKYHIRVIPFKGKMPAGEPTNAVTLSIGPESEEQIVLHTFGEGPYDVQIIQFSPIHWPEPDVCTGAVILDSHWDERDDNNQVVAYHQPGERLCPETYRGEGKEWYEEFVDFVKPAVNWISETYQYLKEKLVDLLASIFCGGDETCKEVLMMGLNAGLAALGVPPTLPNFDQLVDMGIDYLASELAEQITGTDLMKELIKQAEEYGLTTEEEVNQWVKEKLKDGIKEGLNSLTEVRNPSCMGAEEAHRRGVEPLCLPPYVKSHLDPAGQLLPATAVVRITRKPDAPLRDDQTTYALRLSVSGYKDVPPDYKVWVQHTQSWLPVRGPLQGELFKGEWRHIPNLDPGESVTIPIPLEPAEYWAPGHKEAEGGWEKLVCDAYSCWDQNNDFWELYYHGTATINATVGPADILNPTDLDSQFTADRCEAGPLPQGGDPFVTFCQQ